MKRVFHDYGAMIVTVIAVVALIGLTVFLMRPGSVMANAFSAITGQFVDAADEMIDGAGAGSGSGEVPLAAGLYDADDNLVASWDELTTTYGMKVTSQYTSSNCKTNTTSPYYVLTNNSELSSGVKLVIDDSVTSIGQYAFGYCSNLTNIEIPDSVTSIGQSAFDTCTSLTTVNIPEGVTSIKESTFNGCSSLESIEIPASVTSIGQYVFWDCSSLESIVVDSANTIYHSTDNCLIKTATKTLLAGCKNSVIPDDGSVTSIGGSAFWGSTQLESIEIPASVTSISNTAFAHCESLASVTFGDNSQLTSIGNYAFNGCTILESIEIPDSVTSIGTYAFYNCTSLKSATFENTAGWYVSKSSTATSGTNLTLTNTTQSATYLRVTFFTYYWFRK